MATVYGELLPLMPADMLWRRLRLGVEIGFTVDEMLNEETLIPRDHLPRDAAALLRHALAP